MNEFHINSHTRTQEHQAVTHFSWHFTENQISFVRTRTCVYDGTCNDEMTTTATKVTVKRCLLILVTSH